MAPGAALSTDPASATGATGSSPTCLPVSCTWLARAGSGRSRTASSAAGPAPGTACKAVRDLVWTLNVGALAWSAWERADSASPETESVIDRSEKYSLTSVSTGVIEPEYPCSFTADRYFSRTFLWFRAYLVRSVQYMCTCTRAPFSGTGGDITPPSVTTDRRLAPSVY